jgi:hypothetical protein
MRVSRIVLVLGLVAAWAGCKPLYGNKPEAMKSPPKKRPPPEAEVIEAPIAWNEECETFFHEKPTSALPNVTAARALSATATETLVQADRAQDPKSRASLTLESIEKFKAALGKDPYSAEATYGLAVAYTKVLQKGCTLKLLKRLSDLKANPKYEADAQRMIDAAADQNAFKPFKKDAQREMGI